MTEETAFRVFTTFTLGGLALLTAGCLAAAIALWRRNHR